ncbi:unnamed protein product (macronuclear) [Paramecium tetraurelia]|uniref:Uncharacterized protein n=1 Tax=Paramecium tetraurelia TaxID=5888 RepID=A0C412_PARTE|nr:uncharacterized protein GSPATT00035009001 [Paramecium tetraurelia]CAK65529.1 unnamed protein product [Paramecium tetraurelia]|eukprot:XP_001432926.1 hypothetical protein (macronuclear) [Paramecium tetraurelia strain d4-2]
MTQVSSTRFSLPRITENDPKSKQVLTTRAMRPSLFLNQIDIVPNSLKTEAEATERGVCKPIHTEIESDPLIEISYHLKLPILSNLRKSKLQQSLPDLPLENRESKNASPIEYKRPAKRTRLFLRRQESKIDAPVIKFQRKRVEFKKSLIVIDLETGVQDRQELNEVKKPLRRIVHQKTRSYQKKLE